MDVFKGDWGFYATHSDNLRLVWDWFPMEQVSIKLFQYIIGKSKSVWDKSRQDQINLRLTETLLVKTRLV